MVTVYIADVHFDPLIYPRKLHNKDTVEPQPFWVYANTMARDMRAGVVLPPITLAKLDGKNVLIDGYNRLWAHKRNHKTEIEAEFIECKDYDEAYIQAIQRNITHGWRLNDYELADVARKLKEQFGHSDSEISKIISIAPPELKKMTEEREMKTLSGTVILKRPFIGQQVPPTFTDEQQAMFTVKSQLDLLKQFRALIESDLLQLESKSVRRELEEIYNIMRNMMRH